jgi:HAD superfamily hydrolase (TIGR01549 family)
MPELKPALQHIRSLLFDLDGTLLDSYPVHLAAYCNSLSRLGYQLSEEAFLATYSPNWYHTYAAIGLSKDLWDTADAYWLEEAKKQTPILFPGVGEALRRLGEHYPLGIVTSGSRSRVERDLASNGIEAIFEVVITGDDVHSPKPAPEGLELALKALGIAKELAVYIGDTQIDLETAQNAGVQFIGIPSRFASLNAATPCRQVAAFGDLLSLFGMAQ